MGAVYHGRVLSPARLRLVPVGVGAAYAAPGEAQSCYLVRSGAGDVCLDLGAGALNRLQTLVRPESLLAVVITHLHPDHCVDMLALRVYMAWGPGVGRRLRVLGPPGLKALLTAFAGEEGWDEAFAFEGLAPGAGRRELADGLVMTWAEVPHLPPTFAVRLEAGGSSVTYGADCAPNDALSELARDSDVLVCECSFGAGPLLDGIPHLDAAGAAEIGRRAGARRLLLTHCYPEHDRDAALAAAAAGFPGPVDWARQDEEVAA
jgi:ribonuclease BN (tRNA processing enzyme)